MLTSGDATEAAILWDEQNPPPSPPVSDSSSGTGIQDHDAAVVKR
jgi:hypothetical protein